MKSTLNRMLFILIGVMIAVTPTAYGGSAVKCAECGMTVDQGSKFSASLTQDGKHIDFCDIGDLLTYLNKRSLAPSIAQVKDHKTGEPIAADKALYVRAEKKFRTPMGWGIAAFKNKEDAASSGVLMDITEILKAIK